MASVSTGGSQSTLMSSKGEQNEKGKSERQRLSHDLETVNENVHVEDACEDDLDGGRDSISKERIKAYNKNQLAPLSKSTNSDPPSASSCQSPLEVLNSQNSDLKLD